MTTKPCKGIILAGGNGTRLHPITLGTSKQLLPIYDKPMVYYPLSVLMLAGIKDILLITTAEDLAGFKRLLKDGSDFGVSIQYEIQDQPQGIAQALIIGENFIGDSNVALILGDNIFYGHKFAVNLRRAAKDNVNAHVFSYHVSDPQRFGVVELDKDEQPLSIVEKPLIPKSNYALTGLYFLPNDAPKVASKLIMSERGEYEIIDVINHYLAKQLLKVEILGRGFAWLDTGTHESLLEAGQFVKTVEKRQGFKVACLEEIGLNNGWLSIDKVKKRA